MSTHVEPQVQPTRPTDADPWYYGWRYVTQIEPDGTEKSVQVPLTEEDVLHPQEGDFIVNNDDHANDCFFLKGVLDAHLSGRSGVHVFFDHRMDWGVEGIKAHGPDFAVVDGFPDDWDGQRGTFYLSEYGARTLLALEVTSPATRRGDLTAKVDEYYRAGIPYYVIVDRQNEDGEKPRLLAYRRGVDGYVVVEPDGEGWLSLGSIGLWIRFEDGRLVCRDASGRHLLEPAEAINAVADAETRAEAAEEQALVEAQARQRAEAQARAEMQARRLETQAREAAEVRAQSEALARQAAEARAQTEALARQAAEARILQMEAEMNRLRGQS